MSSIDEICGCCFETKKAYCVCSLPKEESKERCPDCMQGRHRLYPQENRPTMEQMFPPNGGFPTKGTGKASEGGKP